MPKIAIVEDNEIYQRKLLGFIRDYEKENNEKFQVKVFSDGLEILDDFSFGFDIIFMDIIMKELDGMKTANIIRQKDKNVIIIFISSVIEFAVQGYSVGALNYIIKPISEYDFTQQLKKALETLNRNNDFSLTINQNGNIIRLNVLDVTYIESMGHDIHINTVKNSYTLRCTMKELEIKLKPYHFIRCNSCYLINLRFVQKISNDTVTVDGKELKMSRSKKGVVRDAVLQYGGNLMI